MRMREGAFVFWQCARSVNERLIGGHKPDESTHEARQVAAITDKNQRRARDKHAHHHHHHHQQQQQQQHGHYITH